MNEPGTVTGLVAGILLATGFWIVAYMTVIAICSRRPRQWRDW